MKILIEWKGHRIGSDIRKIKRLKLTKDKLYLWDETTKTEILLSNIRGLETIKEI